MISIESCSRIRGVIVAVFATAVSGCGQPKGHFADVKSDESCKARASKSAMDESCVIQLSKKEIATRLGGIAYAKYTVRFDSTEQLWIVMAYNENGPPDSHTFLSISPTGEIKDFGGEGQ
jgi:hypothetical protein